MHCVVVGGGISGLVAAYRLSVRSPDLRVSVLEAGSEIGGKLRLADVAAVPVDVGADSVLNRRPEGVDLVRAVGLGDAVCHPATRHASVWTGGRLRAMPPTVLGVPSDLSALARSGVVGPAGVARAAMERLLPPARSPGRDVAVGRWVRRRLGGEVTDRLLEPLLGGVYAGHADRLSLRAAAPQVASLADAGGSLLVAAARSAAARPGDGVPHLAGVVGGVGRLPGAVAEASAADVRTGVTVRDLRRTADGWALVVGRADAPRVVAADAVLLATPAAATARLLETVAPYASVELRRVEAASVAVVTLAVTGDRVRGGLPGSGFLVPPVDGRAVKAATWSSRKWAWLGRRAAEQVGPGTVLLRASFGRHDEAGVLQRDDDELVALAVAELGAAVGLTGQPVDSRVTRWGGALPQYAVGHRDLVDRVRSELRRTPGLDVCGATFDGVGIAACVADASAAADRVAADLSARGTLDR